MNSFANRIWGFIVVVLLCFPMDIACANVVPRGRVGIVNVMARDAVHFHFGISRFGDKDEGHSLPSGPLPEYINLELKQKLGGLGYDVVVVESSLPRKDYPGYLVEKGWRDLKLTKRGKAIVKELVERERLDFVLLLEDFSRNDGLHPGTTVHGHGLYTKAYIGETRVPTAKIFGAFIAAAVSGSDARLLGTSAPPYMVVTEVNALDSEGLSSIEPSLRLLADQAVTGLVMYLDGPFN